MTADELRQLCKSRPVLSAAIGVWAADEIERLTSRVAELEKPQEQWPVVAERDGFRIGACPLCGAENVIGEAAISAEEQ